MIPNGLQQQNLVSNESTDFKEFPSIEQEFNVQESKGTIPDIQGMVKNGKVKMKMMS